MKYIFILFLLILFLFPLIAIESFKQIKYGPAQVIKEEQPSFKYEYEDIYKNLYKKVLNGEKEMYVSQRQYYEQYQEFTVKKDPNVIRIFIIGGSVAHGWEDAISIDEDIVIGKKLEIINVGMPGYDSYRVKLIAQELLSYEPDAIVVLTGNNEYYNQQGFNLTAYKLNKYFLRYHLYYYLKNSINHLISRYANKYHKDREKTLDYFEKNLRSIVRSARSKRVPLILCTLPMNLHGMSSLMLPSDNYFLLGKLSFENEKYSDAIKYLRYFNSRNPENIYGYYYLGQVYEELKDYKEAKENYLKSVEFSDDDYVTPSRNKVIRKISREEDTGFIDLESIVMRTAKNDITGREQFNDHCHIWDEYYQLFDKALIKEFTNNTSDYLRIFGSDKNDKMIPYSNEPFQAPSLKELGKNEDYISNRIEQAAFNAIEAVSGYSERALYNFKTLYLMNPEYLWNIQFSKDSIERDLLENKYVNNIFFKNSFDSKWPKVINHIAETYRRMNLYKEADVYYDKAIELDKDSYLPYLGKALLNCSQGNHNEVLKNIEKAKENANENLSEVQYYKDIILKTINLAN